LSVEWVSRKTAASRRKIVGSEFEAGRWRIACDVPISAWEPGLPSELGNVQTGRRAAEEEAKKIPRRDFRTKSEGWIG
jgi:hypothetical protein